MTLSDLAADCRDGAVPSSQLENAFSRNRISNESISKAVPYFVGVVASIKDIQRSNSTSLPPMWRSPRSLLQKQGVAAFLIYSLRTAVFVTVLSPNHKVLPYRRKRLEAVAEAAYAA